MCKRTIITLTALAAAAGCDNTGAPSELDRPRVLAVQVSPPHLAPEESAPVDVLVGRADGTVAVVAPDSVEVLSAPAGSPQSGMVGHGADGWAIACPDEQVLAGLRATLGLAEGEQVPITLALEVEVEGELLTATKNVYLGNHADNPQLAGVTANGGSEEDGVLVIGAGDEIPIAAEGAEGEGELSYAWFTSVGDIDLYLSEAATLTASDEPIEGQLVLVVRDEQGGVIWSWRDVRVE
jgi:hypothetical protein